MPIAACKIWFADERIFIQLSDDRVIGVPLSWYPKLKNATSDERNSYELWQHGKWIHWEMLDEDLSVEGLLKLEVIRPPSIATSIPG
jgi:hypothetical protein